MTQHILDGDENEAEGENLRRRGWGLLVMIPVFIVGFLAGFFVPSPLQRCPVCDEVAPIVIEQVQTEPLVLRSVTVQADALRLRLTPNGEIVGGFNSGDRLIAIGTAINVDGVQWQQVARAPSGFVALEFLADGE